MLDVKEASSYIILGVIQNRLSLNWLSEAFDESNPHCYFPMPDDRIIDYLFSHGGVISNRAKFNDYITPDGVGRLRDIRATVTGLEIREDGNTLDLVVTIKTAWQRREAINALETAKYRLQDDSVHPVEILDSVVKQVTYITNQVSFGADYNGGVIANEQAKRLALGIRDGQAFIETGNKTLDFDGGLEKNMGHEPIINGLAGVPGSAKTALAGQVAYYVASQGGNVVIVENEQTGGSLLLRQAIQNTGITRYQIKTGKGDLDTLNAEIDHLSTLPIRYLTKPGIEAKRLTYNLNGIVDELGGIDLVIVDHAATLTPIDKRIAYDSPMWLKQIYRDLKNEVIPHYPGSAWLVLQHLNQQIFRVTENKLTPTQDDYGYQTADIFNAAYICMLNKNHGKQLKDYSKEAIEALRLINPQEAKRREQTAYIHCVKHREGNSGIFHQYAYKGALYRWDNAEF